MSTNTKEEVGRIWSDTEPPMDGTEIMALGQVHTPDGEYRTGRVEPFSGLIVWHGGAWCWVHTGLVVAEDVDARVMISHWCLPPEQDADDSRGDSSPQAHHRKRIRPVEQPPPAEQRLVQPAFKSFFRIMKTREWQKIARQLEPEKFQAWLAAQPEAKTWARKDVGACVLHEYVEDATGHSLNINSPELAEHWAERETQEWPTPWWMTWYMRSVDHVGEGPIGAVEARQILAIGIERDWSSPLMSREEFLHASSPTP